MLEKVSDPSSALRAAITTKKACRAVLRGPPGPNQIIQDTVKISTICSPRGSLSTEVSLDFLGAKKDYENSDCFSDYYLSDFS